MSDPPSSSPAQAANHLHYLRLAITEAKKSPPKPTNYCVGAVVVDPSTSEVLATGYTLELPGNTHAEQCCLLKLQSAPAFPPDPPRNLTLYTTMEPCTHRLSLNTSCADLIVSHAQGSKANAKITTVVVGVAEPETFVKQNGSGRQKLEKAGIEFIHVLGLEEEILEVATAGHGKGKKYNGEEGCEGEKGS